MTDDHNDGAMPPPPGPIAPPPLASAPPQMPPPQPVPHPYQPVPYPMPAPGGGNGKWILFIILAFAAGVGATILTLWLTGDLWNKNMRYDSPTSYGSTGSAGASSSFSSVPTEVTIIGTWSTRCPGVGSDAVTFNLGNSVSSAGGSGTYSVSGNYVTVTTNGQSRSLYWEMVDANTARVRRSGDSQTRMIYRCQ